MPNGVDKNLERLLMTCAVYRQRHNSWPSQARLGPDCLWDLANLLDQENFARLAAHLELRTADGDGISVDGHGVVKYEDVDHSRIESSTLELARRWLGVEVHHRDSE